VWDYIFENKPHISTVDTKALPAFINAATKVSHTHREIKSHSIHFSTALDHEFDLKPGDVISICAANSIWYPVAMFGIMRSGATGALSSPGYGEEEMLHAFQTVGCQVVICDMGAFPIVRKVIDRLGINVNRIIILDGKVDGFRSVKELVRLGRGLGEQDQIRRYEIPPGKFNSEICALLCFSSGTTGLAKAVSGNELCSSFVLESSLTELPR
jgi:4-coumarate--CoA ligase